MKVTIKNLEDFRKEMEITIPWEMVSEEYSDLICEYTKFPMKGFRTGKIPVNAIESAYKSRLKNELASRCSSRFCRNALKDNDMEAGSPIEIIEVQLNKNFFFQLKIRFIEIPPFNLPDYSQLDLKSITEEDMLTEISEKLLEKTDLSVPSALIEDEMNYSDPEDHSDELSMRKEAEKRIKLMLIIKKIATRENIEIDNKDLDKRLQLIADENEIKIEQLKNYLINNNGISRISDSLLAEFVLNFIMSIQS